MFEGLSKRLGDVFDKLRGRGALSEADVDAALREVRTALLEADVALPVVRDFIDGVRPKAIGADVIRSVTPGQMVIKIVNDHLVEMLGGTVADLDLNAIPPVVILMVGLQGSGKTTTAGKLARRLVAEGKTTRLVAADVYRPAAIDQLPVVQVDCRSTCIHQLDKLSVSVFYGLRIDHDFAQQNLREGSGSQGCGWNRCSPRRRCDGD